MTEPSQGSRPLRLPTVHNSTVWMTTVAFLLWGMNGVSTQTVVHELRATIALSQHRLDALLRLQGTYVPDTKVQVIRCSATAQSVQDSELRTVRVHLRSSNRNEFPRIEETLERATRPTFLSKECEDIAREMRFATWMHESNKHTVKVLRADHERELAQKNISAEKSIYRLVGFQETGSEEHLDLQQTTEHYRTRVIELQRSLDLAKTKSKGFLSITGSRQPYPIVSPIGWWRLSILAIMATACWFLISLSLKSNVVLSVPSFSIVSWLKNLRCNKLFTESMAGNSMGVIPCLGSVVVWADAAMNIAVPSQSVSRVEIPSTKPACSLHSQKMVIQIARMLLTLWFVFFVVRFLGDGSWRELFLASPLAGLSRLVGGIP